MPVQTCRVPMRDGIELATDIYLPDGQGPWPVLLARTPYDKGQMVRGPVRLLPARSAGCAGLRDLAGAAAVV